MSIELLIPKLELKELAASIAGGWATSRDLSLAPLADVLAIKQDNSLIRRKFHCERAVRASGGKANGRTLRFIASDETVDRMGDVILVKGWDFKDFEKNPVALWGHDAEYPIGNVSNWSKTRRDGRKVLLEDITFTDADVDEFADGKFKLYDAGVLRACSVGFIPRSARRPDEKEAAELGMQPWGVIFEEQEQLELSICSLPANPNALTVDKSLLKEAADAEEAIWDMVDKGQLSDVIAREIVRELLGSPDRPAMFTFRVKNADAPSSTPGEVADPLNGGADPSLTPAPASTTPPVAEAPPAPAAAAPVEPPPAAAPLAPVAQEPAAAPVEPAPAAAPVVPQGTLQELLAPLVGRVAAMEGELREMRAAIEKFTAEGRERRAAPTAVDPDEVELGPLYFEQVFADVASKL